MEPLCQKLFLQLPPPTEEDPRAEKQRILDALPLFLGQVQMALPVMRKLHPILRDAGREHVLTAYREAVRERYRFFSFGDAMYIG